MRHRWLIILAGCLVSLAGDSPLEAAQQRPNVLLIMADDLGFSDLGCYGGEIETPHLDALAGNGLRFTQFYNTARCWPTRAALLTGYYAQQVRRDIIPGVPKGVRTGGRGRRPTWAQLLPVMLRTAGYRSYHSGKWHIDGMPLKNGFDRSYYLGDQGRFFSPRVHFEDDKRLPAVERGTGYYATNAIADHAIKCLKEHAEQHAGQPFFHYLAFTAPHFPLHALPEDIARYRERYRRSWAEVREERWVRLQKIGIVTGRLSDVERDLGPPYHFPDALKQLGPGEVNRPLPWKDLTAEQREFQSTKMAIHAAMIDRMDRGIGRVLDQLRKMKAFDNTLVLFLSDNGCSAEIMVRNDGHDPKAAPGSAATHLCLGPGWSTTCNTPFRRHKTWVHEGGCATPLIAHWPRGIRARGELRHTAGHVIDIVPTILELAGAKRLPVEAPAAPGKSLLAALGKDVTIQRDSLWWLHDGHRAIRKGDWKLVVAKGEQPELFNLREDRTETRNLASKFPERARQLAAAWDSQLAAIRELALRDRKDRPPNREKSTPSQNRKTSQADPFFKPGTIQVIHLQVLDADLARMKAALPKRIYVPATFRWGERTLKNVGVRYKGNSSASPRQKHKRSFLVKFAQFQPGRTFLGLQHVALDNGVQFGSLFSEPLITGILKEVGVTAPRCNFAKLMLNGKFHGVYVNVERIDAAFLKNRFDDASGPLYKVDEGGPGGNLETFSLPPGENNSSRHAFEPKSTSARPDARDVLELISRINDTPPERFSSVLHATIEVDVFLKTMAVMLFAGAFDQLTGWNPHNYYLYREPTDGRWHYLPWDLDVGFADNAFRQVPVVSGWNAAWPIPGGPPRPLIKRIVDDPKLLARYRRLADGILEKHFHPRILLPRIDALHKLIERDLAKDPFPHRRVTNPEDRDYDSIVTSIKNFVRLRYRTARSQLDQPGDRPKIVRTPPRRRPQPGKASADEPTGLSVSARTSSKVMLRWKDNARGEVAHIVQRADGEKGGKFRNLIGQPGSSISTATDTSVVVGRTYRYRVYAIHPTQSGPRGTGVSNTITVRVPGK